MAVEVFVREDSLVRGGAGEGGGDCRVVEERSASRSCSGGVLTVFCFDTGRAEGGLVGDDAPVSAPHAAG